MKKYNNIVGIDPDCDKSGVAFLETKTKKLEVSNLSFPQLLDYMRCMKDLQNRTDKSIIFVVEAGYLNKSNWHLKSKDNRHVAAHKGNSTGRNHETARKIIEMAKHYCFCRFVIDNLNRQNIINIVTVFIFILLF